MVARPIALAVVLAGLAVLAAALPAPGIQTNLDSLRAAYLTGRELTRAGTHTVAADAFRTAAAHPTLRTYAQYEAAAALLRAGTTGAASEAASILRSTAPSAPPRLRGRMLALLGEAEMALGRPAQAVVALQAASVLRPGDPEVWLRTGGAAASAGRQDLARRAYARAAWSFPGHGAEVRARKALSALLGRPVRTGDIDAESRLLRGRRLAQDGEWEQAAVEFRAVVTAATLSASRSVAGEAWYRLGEIYMHSDQRAAHDAFRRAARNGRNTAGAWYWAALTARRVGLTAQAREAASALLRSAPAGFWVARFWLDAGRRAESDRRGIEATAHYRRAIAAAPGSGEAAEARWRLGWVALGAGRHVDAEAAFREAARIAPWRSEAARAWYWAAKTLEARGQRSGDVGALLRMVAEQYPLTFYGQRARARLGLPTPVLPAAPPSTPDASASTAATPTHEELARLGQDADASEAAEDSLGARPGRRDLRVVRFLAETYGRLGEVRRSVAHAEEALAGGVRDQTAWRLAYPKAYWPAVAPAAQAAGIDPLLLLALVREESRYDALAISPARAVGLAQILPTTAKAMTGDPSLTVHRLKDPATNLTLGARYLRLQLDRFDGDMRLALAAYNAGPGAARRWRNLDTDPDYFIEKIGYAETRAYVRRVLGSYGVYRIVW
ncbi:MAG: transglycosylase SLT domain-containing protein [bacterium]|nr:transglycosylase SLT domain-containing protein [bacterium]